MKITHNKVGQNLNMSDSNKADKADKAKDATKLGDIKGQQSTSIRPDASESVKVDLSSRAQDLKQIKNIATSVPDVDQAKVDKFQKLIDAGKYKVDAKAIADRMVDENLMSAQAGSNE